MEIKDVNPTAFEQWRNCEPHGMVSACVFKTEPACVFRVVALWEADACCQRRVHMMFISVLKWLR